MINITFLTLLGPHLMESHMLGLYLERSRGSFWSGWSHRMNRLPSDHFPSPSATLIKMYHAAKFKCDPISFPCRWIQNVTGLWHMDPLPSIKGYLIPSRRALLKPRQQHAQEMDFQWFSVWPPPHPPPPSSYFHKKPWNLSLSIKLQVQKQLHYRDGTMQIALN